MPTFSRDTLILHLLGLLRMKQRLLNGQILSCNVYPVEAMIIGHEGTFEAIENQRPGEVVFDGGQHSREPLPSLVFGRLFGLIVV